MNSLIDKSLEKCKSFMISLQINQRLFREIITQLNDQNLRKQFELIVDDNDRVVIGLNYQIKQMCAKYDDNTASNCHNDHNVDNEDIGDNDNNVCQTSSRCKDTNNKTKMKVCQWPGCSYETQYTTNMTRHMYVHSGNKPHVCDWPQCCKRYTQSSALITHKRTHMNLKPFVCDWIGCDYRTNNRCSLPAHRRTHNGVKNFACDWPQCSVQCSTRTHLWQHQLVHTKHKPFKCDVCDQCFAKKSNMKAHKMSVHLGIKRIRNNKT
ncbi:zinc finger protein 286A-like [Oppia nitens]|uniref:zinc finger protein 286A-like n=1 Tax=Oppia nitens TaxID=1686743 RepID=UPI0023DA7BD5|nr:zinc finger protein 286A-like [Oppia nitens]